MTYTDVEGEIVAEIHRTMAEISDDEVDALVDAVGSARRVFFVGVGRVMLSLEAIAKRWAHLGIDTVVVGQITEPAISPDDLLIVGSGSGSSAVPLAIARKAHQIGAKVAHIGSNPNSPMREYATLFVRIPVQTKLGLPGEVPSVQPMTSLFEQSLLLLGDTIALMLVRRDDLDLASLWQYHANLE